MRETVVRFGERGLLTGILTEPAGPMRDVGWIVLNAGLVHRVGPNRIGVELARAMARSGLVALRFDFSTLGDSGASAEPIGTEAGAIAEVRAAMDQLGRSHGLQRFALFGICSGAEHAFRTALGDSRIVGTALVDGYAYRTVGYYVWHYGPRLMRLGSWRRWLDRNPLARWLPNSRHADAAPEAPLRRYPPRTEVAASFRALVGRGVELLVVYTGGGMADYYSYEGQFFDAFPSLRGQRSVQVLYMRGADHLFTRTESRGALIAALVRWADRFAWREREERVLVFI